MFKHVQQKKINFDLRKVQSSVSTLKLIRKLTTKKNKKKMQKEEVNKNKHDVIPQPFIWNVYFSRLNVLNFDFPSLSSSQGFSSCFILYWEQEWRHFLRVVSLQLLRNKNKKHIPFLGIVLYCILHLSSPSSCYCYCYVSVF